MRYPIRCQKSGRPIPDPDLQNFVMRGVQRFPPRGATETRGTSIYYGKRGRVSAHSRASSIRG